MLSSEATARRVLVIEDEPDIANLIVAILQMEDFEAQAVAGPRSVEIAAAFHPHVVLLDLMMPELDGYEVARRLQENPATSDAKIVVMTAMQHAADRAAALGATAYIQKPFDLAELLRVIDAVM